MSLKHRLRRLRERAEQGGAVIRQQDGSAKIFSAEEAFEATFLFFTQSMRADYRREPRPEPPEVLRAVGAAKDRRDALERVMDGYAFLPVDADALVERGEFVPRSLDGAGWEYGDGLLLEDLSE